MGRHKKSKNGLRNLGIVSLVAVIGIFAKINFFNGNFQMPAFLNKKSNESRIVEQTIPEEIPVPQKTSKHLKTNKSKSTVKVFFIGTAGNRDVYKIIREENTTKHSNIYLAVKALINGPTKYEQRKGVYSEIPQGTKLLAIKETSDKVVINVSEEFESSGGADSLYKRMYQIIKTVNTNTSKPVYLEINGHLVETLGGEGLMIKQPLNGSSLDD